MKISSYTVLSNPQLGDKLIGTDVNNMDVTKNFTIESILALGANPSSYGVLSIGRLAYSGTTLGTNVTLQSTLGAHTITFAAPNTIKLTLTNYVSTGINPNKLYVTSQQTFNPTDGVFQPDLEESNLAAGEIVFYCNSLDGATILPLSSGVLEVRIYN